MLEWRRTVERFAWIGVMPLQPSGRGRGQRLGSRCVLESSAALISGGPPVELLDDGVGPLGAGVCEAAVHVALTTPRRLAWMGLATFLKGSKAGRDGRRVPGLLSNHDRLGVAPANKRLSLTWPRELILKGRCDQWFRVLTSRPPRTYLRDLLSRRRS